MAEAVESLQDSPTSSVDSGASGNGRRRLGSYRQYLTYKNKKIVLLMTPQRLVVKMVLMSIVLINIWDVNGVVASPMLLNI